MRPYMCGDSTLYLPEGGCDCNYTIQEIETTEFARLYHLMLNGEQVGDPVEVPLDKYVTSGDVKTVIADNVPYDGAEIGDRYFQLNLANTDDKVYIPLGALDLNNYYTKAEVDALIPQISSCDLYSVGDVVITSTNETPNLCGTWELIDKEFAYTVITDTGVTWNTTNTSGSVSANSRRAYIIRSGHSISVRLWWTNRIAYGSTQLPICTIAFSSLGLTGAYQHFLQGQTATNKHAIAVIRTGNSDPMTVQYDGIATFGTQTSIDAGQAFYVDFNHVAGYTSMADSACNKFYWRKTGPEDTK